MPKNKTVLQKKIKTPIAFLLLALLMVAGFLLLKTRPAKACCPIDILPPCDQLDCGCEEWCPCPPPCPRQQACPDECHADVVYVPDGQCGLNECPSNAPEKGTCPTECGYQGGTVPDGKCGTIDCPKTEPCEDGPAPTPTQPPSNGNGGTGGDGGGGQAPVCGASTPNAPYLRSATAIGGNKVKIEWNKVDNATHYTISYGPSSGNYLYGVPNAGDTDNFTIEGMSGGCYVVRAVNDCAPSEASNEVCVGAGEVLGIKTKVLGATGSYPKGSILQAVGLMLIALGILKKPQCRWQN